MRGTCQKEEAARHGSASDTATHQVWRDLDKTVAMYGDMMEELWEPAPPHPVTTEYTATNASVF